MRGRLHIARVSGRTDDLCTVLDVLTVILMETPSDALTRWRDGMDRASLASQARAGRIDRSTWGLQPHQIEQQQQFMQTFGRVT